MVKRICVMALVFLLALPAAAVRAQAESADEVVMQVYIAPGAMEDAQAERLIALLRGEFPQGKWSRVTQEDLGTLVLSDLVPQIAIASPAEVMPWAQEGLLLPLDGAAKDVRRMQQQVVEPCVQGERLMMIPLAARQRQMAVNIRLIEQAQFAYLLDERMHPVWMPSELYQAMEGCWMDDRLPLEIWLPTPADSLALEALVQALYGGFFLTQEGEICRADDDALISGLQWLADMAQSGMIGIAKDRSTALNRFLSGETAIFIDWSAQEAERYAQRIADRNLHLASLPYPSATGLPVHAFELTAAAVFDSGDARSNALAVQAASFLSGDAQAQQLLGDRSIWQDDALWLTCLDADARGATLRSLFCRMMEQVLTGGQEAEDALPLLVHALSAVQADR